MSESSSQPPEARMCHQAAIASSGMLVWGGAGRHYHLFPSTTIHVYDLTTRSWFVREAAAQTPEDTPPLCSVATSTSSGRFVYQFGGVQVDRSVWPPYKKYFNDLHVLDTEEFRWRRVCVGDGRRPNPKSSPGLCILKGRLIVFGGLGWKIPDPLPGCHWIPLEEPSAESGWDNELWEIAVEGSCFQQTVPWEPICCVTEMPVARSDHSFTAIDSTRALLYGGVGSGCHLDCIDVFDYELKVWSPVNSLLGPYHPIGRAEHVVATVNIPERGTFLLFLWGSNKNYDAINDGFALEIGSFKCYKLSLPQNATAARYTSVCHVLQNSSRVFFLFFGGSSRPLLSPMGSEAELQLTVLQWDFKHSWELKNVSDAEGILPRCLSDHSSSLPEISTVQQRQGTITEDVNLQQMFNRKPENPEIEKLLPLIADKWKKVVRCLKPQISVREIESMGQADREPVDHAHVALITWLDRYPNEASVFALCDALRASDMASCAECVFNFPVEDPLT
eukprot:m.98100 g.98100  ORF g.98100 m.98100 type:complete len:505 (+) comp36971_c0_seq7:187-1701(+)